MRWRNSGERISRKPNFFFRAITKESFCTPSDWNDSFYAGRVSSIAWDVGDSVHITRFWNFGDWAGFFGESSSLPAPRYESIGLDFDIGFAVCDRSDLFYGGAKLAWLDSK